MAAEFFGNCQICGREQKAHPHAIAKHGYTIRFGWQMGECFGSGAKPYQISNDRIMEAIESAKRYITQTTEKIAELKANPFHADGTIYAEYSTSRFGETRMGYVAITVNQNGQVEATRTHEGRVFLSIQEYVKDVAEAGKKIAARHISSLRHAIKETEAAIPYMQKRYDDWKPAELRAVSEADRAATKIKVHMGVKRWGRTTGICVASASGAQAYKQTTDDRAQVTCAACLKELARLDDLPRLKAEQAEKDRLRGIKTAERDIKDYKKLIKGGGSDENVLYWSRMLTELTNELEALKAKAPAQIAQSA